MFPTWAMRVRLEQNSHAPDSVTRHFVHSSVHGRVRGSEDHRKKNEEGRKMLVDPDLWRMVSAVAGVVLRCRLNRQEVCRDRR